MNTEYFCQIYHVARCGSTLLSALLSTCERTYSEPYWTHSLFGKDHCSADLSPHYGSIVKFQSIATRIGYKPIGPKVFLYRPLAQYLYKMSTCDPNWFYSRKQLYGQWFSHIKGIELINLEPENAMQLHTIFWASCVLEMQKISNILWIQSNEFFLNKELIAKQVLTHFNKTGSPKMEFSNINVKLLGLNGQEKIDNITKYNIDTSHLVSPLNGIIDSSLALKNQQISDTLEWAKINIPLSSEIYI